MSSINNDSVSLDPIHAHASPCLSIVEFYKWFATSGESIFSPVKTSVYGHNNIPISWKIFFNYLNVVTMFFFNINEILHLSITIILCGYAWLLNSLAH